MSTWSCHRPGEVARLSARRCAILDAMAGWGTVDQKTASGYESRSMRVRGRYLAGTVDSKTLDYRHARSRSQRKGGRPDQAPRGSGTREARVTRVRGVRWTSAKLSACRRATDPDGMGEAELASSPRGGPGQVPNAHGRDEPAPRLRAPGVSTSWRRWSDLRSKIPTVANALAHVRGDLEGSASSPVETWWRDSRCRVKSPAGPDEQSRSIDGGLERPDSRPPVTAETVGTVVRRGGGMRSIRRVLMAHRQNR